MKKPLIQDIDRWCAVKFPKSFIAESVNLTIACARFKREIHRIISPTIYKFLDKLELWLK